MKKIVNTIIILFIFIIVMVLLIFYLKDNEEEQVEGNIDNLIYETEPTIEDKEEVEQVDNINTFVTVERCIQQYYDVINNNSSVFYDYSDDGEPIKIVENEEINEMRLDFLSDKYIKDNNINLNNINQYIETTDEKVIVIALKMKKNVDTQIGRYLIQGITISLDYKFLGEFCIYVNLDEENNTFSIEPILEKIDDIFDIEIENDNSIIDENDYNKYITTFLSYEDIAKEYFNRYKMIILSNPKILYNYLDNEYKEKRFKNFNNFETYVSDNGAEIKKLILKEYLINNEKDGIEYICKDQYNNYYLFKETLPMQFTLKLDSYTLITDKFKNEYESGNEEKRVQLSIDRFIKMINSCDYINAYDCLSDNFKENYFITEKEFIEYAKSFFFRYNRLKYNSISKKGNNTYECKLQITDLMENTNEVKNFNIIIQLKDDMNFVMLFDVQ